MFFGEELCGGDSVRGGSDSDSSDGGMLWGEVFQQQGSEDGAADAGRDGDSTTEREVCSDGERDFLCDGSCDGFRHERANEPFLGVVEQESYDCDRAAAEEGHADDGEEEGACLSDDFTAQAVDGHGERADADGQQQYQQFGVALEGLHIEPSEQEQQAEREHREEDRVQERGFAASPVESKSQGVGCNADDRS